MKLCPLSKLHRKSRVEEIILDISPASGCGRRETTLEMGAFAHAHTQSISGTPKTVVLRTPEEEASGDTAFPFKKVVIVALQITSKSNTIASHIRNTIDLKDKIQTRERAQQGKTQDIKSDDPVQPTGPMVKEQRHMCMCSRVCTHK